MSELDSESDFLSKFWFLQIWGIFPIFPKKNASGLHFHFFAQNISQFAKSISQNCENSPQKITVEAILPEARRTPG